MSKLDIKIKTQKKFPDFVAEVDGLSVEDIRSRITKLSESQADIQEAKENDEELADASVRHSELKAPYDEAKKASTLKIRYLRNLAKEKGGE